MKDEATAVAADSSNTVQRFLELLYEPGDVFEIRAPNCRDSPGSRYTFVCSGYYRYDSAEKAAIDIAALDRSGKAPSIYVTMNPVRPALLARSANRIKSGARETTQDKDIACRRWMLVDLDPVRPTGVSSTGAELTSAAERAATIAAYLSGVGWLGPITVMSGNGYHLLYRVDLPAEDDGLVKAVLETLARRFDDEAVTIDRAVHNAARIVKVAGTVSRKGDDLRGIDGLDDRPHRRSELVESPGALDVVPRALLEQIAFVDTSVAPTADCSDRFDCTPAGVRAWLIAHGVAVRGEKRNGDKTLLLLERCPVIPEIESNGGSDIAVLVGADGRLAYCNKHNRGEHLTWRDLRRAVDPEYDPEPIDHREPDISAIINAIPTKQEPSPRHEPIRPPDMTAIPAELFRVPGFISEVMDHTLATAPYPNQVMAFGGALALQAFLAGRKVCDSGDNRSNIYLLGLAFSSAGKDWPRKINTAILHRIGLAGHLGERFASGEGIQDALAVTPSMLFQTDEIDGLIQSITKSTDARHEGVMSTLLTIYSASNSVFPIRRKAGKESPGVIDQPNLVVFGTAIPNHYYEALSERMLTNGFFARMIILEAGQRPSGQEPRRLALPVRVMETAKWWANYRPGPGNLLDCHPTPSQIDYTSEAQELIVEARQAAEREYTAAEQRRDAVGTTVWGRVSEHVRKLALIYAVSENHRTPTIGCAAVEWATAFIDHQVRRMLAQVANHVALNPFHADCLKFMRKLREAGGQLARRELMRAMRCKAADFDQMASTLMQQDEIEMVEIQTRTKPALGYRATGDVIS